MPLGALKLWSSAVVVLSWLNPDRTAATATAAKLSINLNSCRAKYPHLLARADKELVPWSANGISRIMIDRLWRCNPTSRDFDNNRFYGLYVTVRQGKLVTSVAGAGAQRLHAFTAMLVKVSRSIALPDCDFLIMAADHPEQGFFVDNYDATFNPLLAPLLLPFRQQHDNGTVAIPGKLNPAVA